MVAILSDIHGNLEAFNSVLDKLKDFSINRYVILGDIIDYGADSCKIIEEIYKLKSKGLVVDCVLGNHDAALFNPEVACFTKEHGRLSFEITKKEIDLTHRKMLSEIASDSKHLIKENVCILHATSEDPLWGKVPEVCTSLNILPKRSEKYYLTLGGHSHVRGFLDLGDLLYINPGSVGQPRNGNPNAQFIVCDEDFCQFRFIEVPYDIDSAAQKIINSGRPEFLATRLYSGI